MVHDAACGDCARIARDLPLVLRVPVRVRSCRDPHLHAVHPELPADVRACRAATVGTVRADGTVRWRRGLRAAPVLFALVRPEARIRAAGVLGAAMLATARRTPRARRAHRR